MQHRTSKAELVHARPSVVACGALVAWSLLSLKNKHRYFLFQVPKWPGQNNRGKRKFSELNFTLEAKSSKMASPEPSAKRIEFEFKRKLMFSSKGMATDKVVPGFVQTFAEF